jgi:uncharacterized repeat protein (TIGR03847 family)
VSASFELERADEFTAGAVGPPGQRVFYIQAREGGALVTLKCEKEQVSALGEYLTGLLVRVPGGLPSVAREPRDLAEPLEPAWPVGSLGVGYDEAQDRVVVVANEVVEEDEEAETKTTPASARFVITREQAAAFAARARRVVKGGRPTCPMCGELRDPDGHRCPRANGHARPQPA